MHQEEDKNEKNCLCTNFVTLFMCGNVAFLFIIAKLKDKAYKKNILEIPTTANLHFCCTLSIIRMLLFHR